MSTESKYTSEDDDQWLAEYWWVVREMRLTDAEAEIQRSHWVTVYELRYQPAEPARREFSLGMNSLWFWEQKRKRSYENPRLPSPLAPE